MSTTNTNISTVIFDLDGTLYNFNRRNDLASAAVANYAEEHFGISPKEANLLVDECYRRTTDRLGSQNAAIHSRLIRYQLFCRISGYPEFPHASNMASLYWNIFLENLEAEPGIFELLSSLKSSGIRLMLGTNMTADIQFEKLEKLGFGQLLDFIVTSEEAGAEKPSVAFFQYCLKKGGCRPEETLFIGDDLELDYYGAKNAGLHALWYRRYASPASLQRSSSGIDWIDDYRSAINNKEISLGIFRIPLP